MSQTISLSVYLLILSIFNLSLVFTFDQEKYDSALSIYNKIFSIENDDENIASVSLPPEETSQLLVRLQELYLEQETEEGDEIKRADTISFKNIRDPRENVRALVNIAKLSDDKCTRQRATDLNYLMTLNKAYRINIQPYLEITKNKLFEYCNQIFGVELEKKVKNMRLQDVSAINRLGDKIIEANLGKEIKPPHFYISQTNLASGLVSFIKEYTELSETVFNGLISEDDVMKAKKSFGQVFDKTVSGLCSTTISELEPTTLHYFDMFVANRNQMEQLAAKLLHWVRNVHICKEVLNYSNTLKSVTFAKLTQGKQQDA